MKWIISIFMFTFFVILLVLFTYLITIIFFPDSIFLTIASGLGCFVAGINVASKIAPGVYIGGGINRSYHFTSISTWLACILMFIAFISMPSDQNTLANLLKYYHLNFVNIWLNSNTPNFKLRVIGFPVFINEILVWSFFLYYEFRDKFIRQT